MTIPTSIPAQSVPVKAGADNAPHPEIDSVTESRELALAAWLRERGSALLGFSGGVDSAYLACIALDVLGPDRFLAVIGRSASYPGEQWREARAVADRFGIPVLEIDTDELSDPSYAANPANRCYFCKSELWGRLVPVARERGFATVLDGTNADDRGDYRPGGGARSARGSCRFLAGARGYAPNSPRGPSRRGRFSSPREIRRSAIPESRTTQFGSA